MIEACGDMGVNIEIKNSRDEPTIADTVVEIIRLSGRHALGIKDIARRHLFVCVARHTHLALGHGCEVPDFEGGVEGGGDELRAAPAARLEVDPGEAVLVAAQVTVRRPRVCTRHSRVVVPSIWIAPGLKMLLTSFDACGKSGTSCRVSNGEVGVRSKITLAPKAEKNGCGPVPVATK